jgi:mitochondrial import receptor subunit TOM40
VSLGAEFSLTRSKMNLCVDGTGRIQSVLEAKLGREQGSPALNFAAELDHGKNVMRFGYGLNIGS